MTEQQARKRDMRAFIQTQYSDERLAMLLAHARDGKLAYFSCCCLIGIVTTRHPLRGRQQTVGAEDGCNQHRITHFQQAYSLPYAEKAHCAYAYYENDIIRRRVLIPIIRAEMWRREKLRQKAESTEAVAV